MNVWIGRAQNVSFCCSLQKADRGECWIMWRCDSLISVGYQGMVTLKSGEEMIIVFATEMTHMVHEELANHKLLFYDLDFPADDGEDLDAIECPRLLLN